MANVKIPEDLSLDSQGAVILANSLDLRARKNLIHSRANKNHGKLIIKYDTQSGVLNDATIATPALMVIGEQAKSAIFSTYASVARNVFGHEGGGELTTGQLIDTAKPSLKATLADFARRLHLPEQDIKALDILAVDYLKTIAEDLELYVQKSFTMQHGFYNQFTAACAIMTLGNVAGESLFTKFSTGKAIAQSIVQKRNNLHPMTPDDVQIFFSADLVAKLQFSYITRNGTAFRDALFTAVETLTGSSTELVKLGEEFEVEVFQGDGVEVDFTPEQLAMETMRAGIRKSPVMFRNFNSEYAKHLKVAGRNQ